MTITTGNAGLNVISGGRRSFITTSSEVLGPRFVIETVKYVAKLSAHTTSGPVLFSARSAKFCVVVGAAVEIVGVVDVLVEVIVVDVDVEVVEVDVVEVDVTNVERTVVEGTSVVVGGTVVPPVSVTRPIVVRQLKPPEQRRNKKPLNSNTHKTRQHTVENSAIHRSHRR